MGNVAFKLREEYAGTPITDPVTGEDTGEVAGAFEGGVIGVPPDGEPFDLKAALDEGPEGVIVANSDTEPQLVQQLETHPALEHTEVPEGAGASGYAQQAATALKETVRDRGLKPGNRRKEELVELLQTHDRLVDAGYSPEAASEALENPDIDIDAALAGAPEEG